MNGDLNDLMSAHIDAPKNSPLDMDKFIAQLKTKGKKIGVYPIDDSSWKDVGEWNEYKKVVDLIK